MGKAWTIGAVCGIPLRVHPSWLITVGLLTVLFQEQYGQILQDRQLAVTAPNLWLLGFLTVLLLFGSALLHELGHALVALRHGVKVDSITLFVLGCWGAHEKECRSALAVLQAAAAGPAVSFALALSFFLLADLSETVQPVAALVCQRLMILNLVYGIANLLMPGLPFDGGLIVKALVWHFSGSRRRGIEVAAAAGRALAVMAIASGLWLILVLRAPSGLWLVLLGWFGLEAASAQLQEQRLQDQLLQLRVQQVQGRRYRILDAQSDLRTVSRQLAGETAEMGPQDWLLVYEGHCWLGRFQPETFKTLPVQCWSRESVSQRLQPREEIPTIRDSAPLWQAALALEDAPEARLLVLSGAGLPSGTIDRVDLVKAVCKGLGIRLPEAFLNQVQRLGLYPPGLQLGLVASTMADSEDANPSFKA